MRFNLSREQLSDPPAIRKNQAFLAHAVIGWRPGGNTPIELDGPSRTISALLNAAADRFELAAAATDGARTISYADLPHVSGRAASTFYEYGVGPGDRVMVISENRLEVIEAMLGCAWSGAVFVPVNPATPVSQLRYFLDYVEPRLVLIEGESWERFAELSTDDQSERGVVLLSAVDWGQIHSPVWSLAGTGANPRDSRPADPLGILLTSGTTGVSKGVVCPNSQFITWGETVGSLLSVRAGDVAYTCLPLFHTNALNATVQCWVHGATFHLGTRFSASRFWQRATDAGATVTYLLGAMVSMLNNQPPSALDRRHTVTRILAPGTPLKAMDEFEHRFGATLFEGHGMTETNLVISPTPRERRRGYMGMVRAGFEARVVDEDDHVVPDGSPGELVMRADDPLGFSTGYWRLPEATLAANRGGWFHSGDRVVQDEGWFRFLDRLKDVIRRRGENISAWEVEQALDSCPWVERSSVVPVPSELGEDEVLAFVVAQDGRAPDPRQLIEHCAALLPRFAIPRYIEFIHELPLTETGKVRKTDLRDRGVGLSTWDASQGSDANNN